MIDKICIILINICVLINCLHIRYIYKNLNNRINRYENNIKSLNNELLMLRMNYKEDLNNIVRAIHDGDLKEIKNKKVKRKNGK